MREKKECCGCGACFQACPTKCITMELDEEGFSYPVIDDSKCIKCGRCTMVCPYEYVEQVEEPQVFAATCLDDEIRYNSSSGGIFTVLANAILSIDGIVCGVKYDSENHCVQHILVEKEKDLKLLQGSKYIQSTVGYSYLRIKEYLNNKRFVLFSGTSCQVAGLLSFLGKDYNNLLCVEVICHGVPSSKLWKKYIDYVENKENKKIENVYFRSKKYSWNDFGVSINYLKQKEKFNFSFEDPFFRMFNSNLCLRPSCYDCKFKGLHTKADISLGDFWNIENIDASYNDGRGLSVVLLNNNKGRNYFEKVASDLKVYSEGINYSNACDCNKAIINSMRESDKREQFFYDLEKMEFKALENKYVPMNAKKRIKGILLRLRIWPAKLIGGTKGK